MLEQCLERTASKVVLGLLGLFEMCDESSNRICSCPWTAGVN